MKISVENAWTHSFRHVNRWQKIPLLDGRGHSEWPEKWRGGNIVFGQQMSLGGQSEWERELVEERREMEQPRAERRWEGKDIRGGRHAGRKRDSRRMCCWHWTLWITQAACAWPICMHVNPYLDPSKKKKKASLCMCKSLNPCAVMAVGILYISPRSCCVSMHIHSTQQQVVFSGLMKPGGGPQSTFSFCLSSPCQQIQGHL